MFPYVSKEFNVRTAGDGIQVPCMDDLENAFPKQFFIGFTTRTEFSDQIYRIVAGQNGRGQDHAGHGMIWVYAMQHHQDQHQVGQSVDLQRRAARMGKQGLHARREDDRGTHES